MIEDIIDFIRGLKNRRYDSRYGAGKIFPKPKTCMTALPDLYAGLAKVFESEGKSATAERIELLAEDMWNVSVRN